jgi:hypothetical protein
MHGISRTVGRGVRHADRLEMIAPRSHSNRAPSSLAFHRQLIDERACLMADSLTHPEVAAAVGAPDASVPAVDPMADSPTHPEVVGAVSAPDVGVPAVDPMATDCQKSEISLSCGLY